MSTAVVERLRALCLALPEVTERLSHGEPTWFVRKVFVQLSDHHHDDRLGFWCACTAEERDALVAEHPEPVSTTDSGAINSTSYTSDLDRTCFRLS